jgi:hypothetical protein
MKFLNSIKNIFSGLYLSIRRFPITIFLSTLTAVILITISETRPAEDTLAKLAMVIALGIPLSLCIKLFLERKAYSRTFITGALYLSGALVLVLYYLLFLENFNMIAITRYIAVSIALYLAFIYIPYLPRRVDFEPYVITLFSNFFITIIYSLVLFAGLSAILFAVDNLLGINIKGEVYYYTWLIVIFIFAVSYFLSGVPNREDNLSSKDYPKLLKILLLYIVMPLLSAYTIILYIYFIKIIVTRQWPVNIVTHLVLWYSVISALVLFFITPIKESISWVKNFMKLLPKLIIPLLVMMFISLYIRIKAYGITENRYFVLALAVWVLGVMVYFSLAKNYKNIIILVSLSIIALISVLGPISSYSLSKLSQNSRLEGILARNNMLKNAAVQPSGDISKEDRLEISSILNYFEKNHTLKEVKNLPEDFKIEDMNKVFGFAFENPYYGGADNYFYFRRVDSNKSMDIKGYDYLFDRYSLMEGGKTSISSLDVTFNYEPAVLKVNLEGKQVYTKDFSSFIKNLVDKYGTQSRENNLPAEEMTIIEENDKVKIKILITHISGMKDRSSGELNSKDIEFYILVKIK